MALILGSLYAYNNVVAAPIDLPHSPILLTPGKFSIKSTITLTSSFSWYPNEIYSPSLNPHPGKSITNKFILCFNNISKLFNPSKRDDEFPWRYKTTGISMLGRYSSIGSIKEHFIKYPSLDIKS